MRAAELTGLWREMMARLCKPGLEWPKDSALKKDGTEDPSGKTPTFHLQDSYLIYSQDSD